MMYEIPAIPGAGAITRERLGDIYYETQIVGRREGSWDLSSQPKYGVAAE